MAFSTAMSRVRWMVQTVRKATITNDEIPYRKACIKVRDPFSLLKEPSAWNEPVRDSLTVRAAALASAPSTAAPGTEVTAMTVASWSPSDTCATLAQAGSAVHTTLVCAYHWSGTTAATPSSTAPTDTLSPWPTDSASAVDEPSTAVPADTSNGASGLPGETPKTATFAVPAPPGTC